MDWMLDAIGRNRTCDTETARAFCEASGIEWRPNRTRTRRHGPMEVTQAELIACFQQSHGTTAGLDA